MTFSAIHGFYELFCGTPKKNRGRAIHSKSVHTPIAIGAIRFGLFVSIPCRITSQKYV